MLDYKDLHVDDGSEAFLPKRVQSVAPQNVKPAKWVPLSETALMDRVDEIAKKAQEVEKKFQEKALKQIQGLMTLLKMAYAQENQTGALPATQGWIHLDE